MPPIERRRSSRARCPGRRSGRVPPGAAAVPAERGQELGARTPHSPPVGSPLAPLPARPSLSPWGAPPRRLRPQDRTMGLGRDYIREKHRLGGTLTVKNIFTSGRSGMHPEQDLPDPPLIHVYAGAPWWKSGHFRSFPDE
jgi:hypothetical protein